MDLAELKAAHAKFKNGSIWKNYANANKNEAAAFDKYVNAVIAGQNPSPPLLNTATGQGLVGYVDSGFKSIVKPISGNPVPALDNAVYIGAYIEGKQTNGYYYPGSNWSNAPLVDPGTVDSWDRFEQDAGKKVKLLMFGQPNPWAQNFQQIYFDVVANKGAIPVVDMMTGSTLLVDITAGKYDAQITAWAKAAAIWGRPLVLRLNCEMNGGWYDYGSQARINPSSFVDAWKHFHELFNGIGVKNVSWHWCPNIDPDRQQTPLEQLYPGDPYVDWTGFTGYNHGKEPFDWLFQDTYNRIAALAPTKPMMIGEIGSVDVGYPGEKVAFIKQFGQLKSKMPQVKGFCWFNWRILENNKIWDWPIQSSPESLTAFKQIMSDSYFVGR